MRSHPSPSRTALVLRPERSEPAPGSVSAQASRYSPRTIGATKRSACSGVTSSSSSRGPRSTTANPSPFVALPDSSSIATWPSMESPIPPCSGGMFSIAKPASRAFLRRASTSAASIDPRSAIRCSSG